MTDFDKEEILQKKNLSGIIMMVHIFYYVKFLQI